MKKFSGVKKLAGNILRTGDFILLIITLVLVIFGVIMVFSSSYYYALSQDGSAYSYLKRDLVWVFAGGCLLIFFAVYDYNKLKKWAIPFLALSLLLLVLVLMPGIGITRNNATRWIGAGGVTIMPGELIKLALIIFTAAFLGAKTDRIKTFTKGIFPLLLLCGVCGALIVKQPNLSTAITVVLIIIVMMLVAGMSWWWIAVGGAAGAVGIMAIMMSGNTYWHKRLTSFVDPFADPLGNGYQVVQSLLAMGSGGLFGVGLGKSIQKNLYLPEPQNDFILAIIGEELGFIGIMLLLLIYMLLIWRGVNIAINAPDQFGTLLATGITAMVGIQVILNIAVVTSSMPPTGVTLPFVSYGGNAQMLFMSSMGILLNISRHKKVH